MSFQIVPKAAPAPVEGGVQAQSQAAAERRAKAIAMISGVEAPRTDTAPAKKPEQEEAPKSAAESAPATIEDSATPETAAAAPAAKVEEPLSSQYAQLARKEKAIRMQAQQVKAQNDALAAREAAIKAKESEMTGDSYIPKERLAKDTLKVLQEAGLDYEQITQLMLNGPSPEAQQQASVIAKLEAKIAALEEGQTKVTKNFEDSQRNAYTQAISQIKTEAKHAVYTNPDYETIKETNSVNDVVDLIVQTFEKGLDAERPKGTLLTVDEAAKLVEEHLYEEAFKLTNLKKIQKRLAESKVAAATPQAPAGKQAESSKDGVKQVTMKTLTNRDGSARKLTSSERAILAFKGELPK